MVSRLGALLLCLGSLCLSCGDSRTLLVIAVSGGEGLPQLAATATLAGDARTKLVNAPFDRFSFEFPEAARGEVVVGLAALGADGCSQLGGQGAVVLEGPGVYELAIALQPDAAPRCPVRIERQGEGAGSVTSTPEGIRCGDGAEACTALFVRGSKVTLSAQAALDARLVDWQDGLGRAPSCDVTVSGARVVRPLFYKKICSPDGFCWEAPLPEGVGLRSIFALAPDNVYAVGGVGTILHYDGEGWKLLPRERSPDEDPALGLQQVFALGDKDVWVVGEQGTVLRSTDGQRFARVPASGVESFLAVGGTAASGVYVASYSHKLWRWDGAALREVTIPAGAGAPINGLWAQGSTVWIVGDKGFIAHTADGSGWTPVPGQSADFAAVLGRSPTDVFVAGTNKTLHLVNDTPTEQTTAGVISGLFFAGAQLLASGDDFYLWDSGAKSWMGRGLKDSNYYSAVHGSDATHVWMTGDQGAIVRWDGQDQQLLSDESFDADSLTGTSSTDLWRQDDYGFYHYDGRSSQKAKIDTPGDPRRILALGADTVFGVGTGGKLWKMKKSAQQPVVYGFSDVSPPPAMAGGFALEALYATDTDHLWLVGSDEKNPPPTKGVILSGAKGVWTAVTMDGAVALPGMRRVFGVGTQVWAVGERSVVMRQDGGGAWRREPILADPRIPDDKKDTLVFTGIHGTDAAHLFATAKALECCAGYVLQRQPQGAWAVVVEVKNLDLNDVVVTGDREAWAVGGNYRYSLALQHDGQSWTPRDVGADSELRAVWLSKEGHLWVGGDGALLRRLPR